LNLYILSEIQAEGNRFGPPERAGFPHLPYTCTLRYYVPYRYTFGGIGCPRGENSLRCEFGGYRGRCECELVVGMNCVNLVEVVNVS